MELHIGTHQEVGHRSRHQRGNQQRQRRGGTEVEHKHLKHKHNARKRSLEDARYGPRRATPQQNAHTLGAQPHPAADIGPYGRTRGSNRRLQSHAAAKGHRERRGDERRIHILGRQTALVAADGQQHRWQPVSDVATHYIPDKQHRQRYAHQREHQHHHVASQRRQRTHTRHHHSGIVHQRLQRHRRQARQQSHHNGQHQHIAVLAHVTQSPTVEFANDFHFFSKIQAAKIRKIIEPRY